MAVGHRLVLVLPGVLACRSRWVRRLAGPRFLRSDVYWKILAFEERYHVEGDASTAGAGLPDRENVIQDIEVPVDRLAEFVARVPARGPDRPVLAVPPAPARPGRATWDLYRLDPDELYVNVGFWSTVPLAAGHGPGHHNRWVEDEVDRLGGRKSLYSTSFYDEERFWELYNGSGLPRAQATDTTRRAGYWTCTPSACGPLSPDQSQEERLRER